MLSRSRIERALDRGALSLARHATLLVVVWMGVLFAATILIPVVRTQAPRAGRLAHLAFRIACHQIPSRCLVIAGHPAPVCARCHAIYLGMALGGAISLHRRIRRLPLAWLGVAAIPIATDGFTQLFMLRESNTTLRLLTGFPWGLALTLFAVPLMRDGLAEAAAEIQARLAPAATLPTA